MIKLLLKFLFGRNPNKGPTKKGKITSYEIKRLFTKNKKDNVIYLNSTKIYIVDEKYDLMDKKTLTNFLFRDKTNFQKFKKDNDCDNFAFQLLGRMNEWAPTFALGFAISSNHAFNIFVDENKKVWIIEPQSDKIMSLEEAKKFKGKIKYYPFKMVLI